MNVTYALEELLLRATPSKRSTESAQHQQPSQFTVDPLSTLQTPGSGAQQATALRQMQQSVGNSAVQRLVANRASAATIQRAAAPTTEEEKKAAATPAGLYADLGMKDMTADLSKLPRGKFPGAISSVVLHQTDSTTAASSINGYKRRIKDANPDNMHVGAHYLIDTDGQMMLTAPTNLRVDHTKGRNSTALGIENVGKPSSIKLPSGPSNAEGMQQVRAALEALNLSPELKKRLLAMKDRELYRTLRDSEQGLIYGDINGPQKRATWLLANRLKDELKLDLTNDFVGHEQAAAKTLGEGENIKEFVTARQAYPETVRQLEQWIADHAPTWSAGLALLEQERATLDALSRDGTEAESTLLDSERAASQPGEATARRALVDQFYAAFYTRVQRLNALLALVNALPALSAEEVQTRLNAATDPLERGALQTALDNKNAAATP
jgi:hypothetical protein